MSYLNNTDYTNIHVSSILNSLPESHTINTGVCCWWCKYPIEEMPIGIPFKIENDVYIFRGLFCSLCCAKTYLFNYNDEIFDKYDKLHTYNIFLSYIKKNYEVATLDINFTHDWRDLEKFGGDMNINEFRLGNKQYIKLETTNKPYIFQDFEKINISK